MQVMTGIFKTKPRQPGMRETAPITITATPTPQRSAGFSLFLAGMPVSLLAWHNTAGRMRILSPEADW
jgi:hypothetical protein